MSRLQLPQLNITENDNGLLTGISHGPCIFDERSPTNHPHCHNCYELCLVFAGSGSFVHGDQQMALGVGDVFVANPSVIHEISSFTSFDLELVFYQFTIAAGSTGLLHRFVRQHMLLAPKRTELLELLKLIDRYLGMPEKKQWTARLVSQLLLECIDALTLEKPEESDQAPVLRDEVSRATAYIRQQLPQPTSVAEIAQAAGISARRLQELFREELGKTIVQWTNTERMRRAADLLLMGYRVHEVTDRMAINSATQFTRIFKQYHGISPKQYQLQHAPHAGRYRTRHELHRD